MWIIIRLVHQERPGHANEWGDTNWHMTRSPGDESYDPSSLRSARDFIGELNERFPNETYGVRWDDSGLG